MYKKSSKYTKIDENGRACVVSELFLHSLSQPLEILFLFSG